MAVGKCGAGSEKCWGSRRGRDMRSGGPTECEGAPPGGLPLKHEPPRPNKTFHRLQNTYIYPRCGPPNQSNHSAHCSTLVRVRLFILRNKRLSPGNWGKYIFEQQKQWLWSESRAVRVARGLKIRLSGVFWASELLNCNTKHVWGTIFLTWTFYALGVNSL